MVEKRGVSAHVCDVHLVERSEERKLQHVGCAWDKREREGGWAYYMVYILIYYASIIINKQKATMRRMVYRDSGRK